MAGQVDGLYRPPYGVNGSFQTIVRKGDVSHGADEDLTREPQMV